MLDQYAAGMAMNMVLEQHKRRRDLLMFSALPDAPVRPIDPPTRAQRLLRQLSSMSRTFRRTSRTGDVVPCRQPVTGSPSTC
jgi:hypothetical protein